MQWINLYAGNNTLIFMDALENLKNLMKWLNENQWLNIIFLIIAILGIVVSVFLYLKGKNKKKPVFSIRSVNVISDSIQSLGDILVTYFGRPVENLTVTKIAVWNSGNDTLNSIDQAPTDKLRIETEQGIQIFKADIIFESHATNNLKACINSNVIDLTFDFLDHNQGGIIKIVHSGKKSDDLKIKGTFKSAGSIKKINVGSIPFDIISPFIFLISRTTKDKILLSYSKSMPWILLITGLVFGSLPLLFNLEESNNLKPPNDINLVFPIVGAIYVILSLYIIFKRNYLPKGFSSFYNDE